MSSEAAAQCAAVLDGLIPGDGERWPAFSVAVDAAIFAEACAPELRQALAARGRALLHLAPAERAAALAAWEQAEPQTFADILRAAHRSYYTAPQVLAAVAARADAGPRETSPTFDPSLVARVIETNAGRRRL